MMMKSPSTMHLLPTGGFRRARLSSIQRCRSIGGRRLMASCREVVRESYAALPLVPSSTDRLPMLSWYHDRTPAPEPRAAPKGRRDASVVIVGGGFAGLNTALGLAARGVRDIVLLEANSIGFGASGRNGGFVFAGYSLGEKTLLQRAG